MEGNCLSGHCHLSKTIFNLHQDIPVCICGELKPNLRCCLKVPGKLLVLKYVLYFVKPENHGIKQEQFLCHPCM